jgi:very-short-patch-repair endonuclease
MQVIQNEFNDKNYIREYPFGIYSIDFAWPDKKIAIEIDGEQHLRFESYKEKDLRKDELLKNNGWLVLRIRWKDMYNDTKRWIKIAKIL